MVSGKRLFLFHSEAVVIQTAFQDYKTKDLSHNDISSYFILLLDFYPDHVWQKSVFKKRILRRRKYKGILDRILKNESKDIPTVIRLMTHSSNPEHVGWNEFQGLYGAILQKEAGQQRKNRLSERKFLLKTRLKKKSFPYVKYVDKSLQV